MFERYGPGTITKIPSIEEILNYDKDTKVNEVEEEPVKGDGSIMEGSQEVKKKILKTENKDMKDRIEELEVELNERGELLQAKSKRCDTLEEEKLATRKNFDDLHVMA